MSLGRFTAVNTTISATALAALPLLLYVYMPRLPQSHLLVYPIVTSALFAVGSLLAVRNMTLHRPLLVMTFLCLLLSGAAGISALVNSQFLRLTGPLVILRPAALLTFFAYGYYVTRIRGKVEAERGLLIGAYIILCGQFLVALLQLLGLSPFDFIYSERVLRPLGGSFRITGTLVYPSQFGWMVSQATVLIVLLSAGRSRYLAVAVGALLVLASGSRSVFVMFPLMVGTAFVLRPSKSTRLALPALSVGLGLGIAFVVALAAFGDYFRYLAELWKVQDTGSLMSVHSFAVRVEMWQRVYSEFEAAGPAGWLVGLGSRESTKTLDNHLLYVLFRLGVLGLTIHIGILGFISYICFKRRTSAVANAALQYMFFALLLGVAVDTLGGWFYPLLLFYLAGLTAGLPMVEGVPAPARSVRQRAWTHLRLKRAR